MSVFDYDNKAAEAQARRLANRRGQYEFRGLQESDAALPSILMGLGQGQSAPQPPMPGQASVPSPQTAPVGPVQSSPVPPQPMPPPGGAPLSSPSGASPSYPPDGPGVSRMPEMGGQPQGQPPASQYGGYDLPTLVNTIKSQYPNVSGAGMRNILATVNPYMLTPSARIQLQRLGIQQQNANTNEYRADVAGSNNQVRQLTNFGEQKIPTPPRGAPSMAAPPNAPTGGIATPPMGNNMPGGDIGGNANAMATITKAASPQGSPSPPMGGGLGGVAPTSPVKGQNQEAVKNADVRTQNIQSMQNDMQLADNLNQLGTLLENPSFTTGAGAGLRSQAANVMYYMTGDPKWNDAATIAQLDQKTMNQILIDQIATQAAQSGGGNRSMATDVMKRYIAQSKPEDTKTPAANRSIVQGMGATLQRNSLMKQFFNDVTQRNGIYPQDAAQAVFKADQMYPVVTINQNGTLQVNKDNVAKFSQALSQRTGNDYTSFELHSGQAESPTAGKPPQTGEVMDGYKFKGGDPAKQENWEPVGGK